MTRKIQFEGERAERRFEFLYTALLSAGDGKGDRSRETIRKEARILDALDSVSEEHKSEGLTVRRLQGEGSFILQQDDFELLTKYLENGQWTPRVAREAVDAMDWFGASEKID